MYIDVWAYVRILVFINNYEDPIASYTYKTEGAFCSELALILCRIWKEAYDLPVLRRLWWYHFWLTILRRQEHHRSIGTELNEWLKTGRQVRGMQSHIKGSLSLDNNVTGSERSWLQCERKLYRIMSRTDHVTFGSRTWKNIHCNGPVYIYIFLIYSWRESQYNRDNWGFTASLHFSRRRDVQTV